MSFGILAWDHRILLYLAHIPPDYFLPSHINLSQLYHPGKANHHHSWYKIQYGLQLTQNKTQKLWFVVIDLLTHWWNWKKSSLPPFRILSCFWGTMIYRYFFGFFISVAGGECKIERESRLSNNSNSLTLQLDRNLPNRITICSPFYPITEKRKD